MFRSLVRTLKDLLRNPVHTVSVVLILGLGVGVDLALGSLLQRLLLRPFDGPAPERVVAVSHTKDGEGRSCSAHDFLALQSGTRSLSHLAASALRAGVVDLGDRAIRVRVSRTSASLFPMLGLPPHFRPEHDRAGEPPGLVLTHAFWSTHLGEDPAALGRSLRLDGQDWRILGVLPRHFRFPAGVGGGSLLVPLALTPQELEQRNRTFLNLVGRLAPGVTREAAEQEIAGLYDRLEYEVRAGLHGTRTRLPLQVEAQVVQRPLKLALTLACGFFVLLIVCANVANLSLARWLARRRDLGLRAALGAGRWSLLRPLLEECLLLALAGGLLAGLLHGQTLRLLTAVLGPSLPALRGDAPGFVALPVLALSLLAALLMAIPVSWSLLRLDPARAVGEAARGAGGASQGRLRGALVVTQMATATALVGTALLLARSLHNMTTIPLGFRPEGVLACQVQLPERSYPTEASRLALQRALLERAAALPGVRQAGVLDELPVGAGTWTCSFHVPGAPPEAQGRSTVVHLVAGDYFGTLGQPLVAGRTLAEGETDACVINTRLARLAFGAQDPLGRVLDIYRREYRVVGVVEESRHDNILDPCREQAFLPFRAQPWDGFTLFVKGDGAPSALAPPLRELLRSLDPGLPGDGIRPLQEALARQTQEWRAVGMVFNSLALLALALAGLGMASALSLAVIQQTPELGVRMALGARSRDILAQVLGRGLRQVALGLALGLPAAGALGLLLRHQLYGLSPGDPFTAAAAAAILALAGLVSCLLPALRAARIQPMEALRQD